MWNKRNNSPPDALAKAVTVSSDNYVLDGTNRWARNLELKPEGKVNINRMSIPVREALDLMFSFPKVFSKTLAQVGATQKGDKDGHAFHGNQWTDHTGQTETKEFKDWFGDSKVTDKDGKPLPVYHGTDKDLTTIEPRQMMGRKRFYNGELGAWFGSNTGIANVFSDKEKGAVYPTYLSIKNPKEYSSWFKFLDSVEGRKSARAVRAELEKDGYDGIVIRDSKTDFGGLRDDWVAFKNTQIKSAIGNSGKFDPKDSNITKMDFVKILKTA